MFSGLGIQLALAAVLLLAQLGLPMAHGLASFGADHDARATSLVAPDPDVHSQPDAARHGAPTHDPNLCPICLALSQVRNGVGRVPALAPLQIDALPTGLLRSPSIALASRTALDSAPPRAPPLRPLSLV